MTLGLALGVLPGPVTAQDPVRTERVDVGGPARTEEWPGRVLDGHDLTPVTAQRAPGSPPARRCG